MREAASCQRVILAATPLAHGAPGSAQVLGGIDHSHRIGSIAAQKIPSRILITVVFSVAYMKSTKSLPSL
jgi:hypothetical protein